MKPLAASLGLYRETFPNLSNFLVNIHRQLTGDLGSLIGDLTSYVSADLIDGISSLIADIHFSDSSQEMASS